MSVIGFDFGNETCLIAAAKSGGIEVLDNEYSLRLTPSYVGFSGYSRNIGVSAKNKIIPNIKNTIFNFKTILGKKLSDKFIERELFYLPYDTFELPSGDIGVEVNYQNENVKLSIHQITAIIMAKLKSIAEHKTVIKTHDCVISVPIYYTDAQRRALLDAAEIAGLKVSQLLNETTAAAIFYGFYKRRMFETEPKIVVFVDLGHSALTVTACKFYEEKLSVLGSLWNMQVGGRAFDTNLVRHFVDDFKERYNIDVTKSKKALMTLFLECEALKKQMSANPQELEINIECLMEDIDVKGRMKREQFENISALTLSGIEKTMRDLVSQCHLNTQDVDTVQLIGGSSRLPALKNVIVKIFSKEPQTTLNQDEAVARGCCLQCALLSPTLLTKPYQIEDVQPYAIMMIYKCGDNTEEIPLFHRFHKIPLKRVLSFPYKGQFALEVYFGCGEGEFESMGQFYFADISKEVQYASNARVQIKVSIDINGVFNILSAEVIAKYENSSEECNSEDQTMVVVPFEDQASSTDGMKQDLPTDDRSLAESAEKRKDVVKSHSLEFLSVLHKLDRNDIEKYKTEEQKMRESDLKCQRIADLRNSVEEYIFYAKDKLDNELSSFVSEDIKLDISERLNAAQNWLYDTGDLQDEGVFNERLNDLKQIVQPILNQYSKVQDVKSALHEFQKLLLSNAKDIQSISEEKNRFQNCEGMKERWNRANDFVRLNLNAINRIKCFDAMNISPNWVQEEMKSFQDELQKMKEFEAEPTNEQSLKKNGDKEGEENDGDKHEKIRQVPIEMKFNE